MCWPHWVGVSVYHRAFFVVFHIFVDHFRILEDTGLVELNDNPLWSVFFFAKCRTANRSLRFALDFENTMLNVPIIKD